MNVGTDYIAKSLKTIMDKYVKFYNDPGKFAYKRRDKLRWKQVIDGQGKTLESYGLDIELHGAEEHNGIKFAQQSNDKVQVMLDYPVPFNSKPGNNYAVSGKINFGLNILFEKKTKNLNLDATEKNVYGKDANEHWELSLDYLQEATITKFECSADDETCANI